MRPKVVIADTVVPNQDIEREILEPIADVVVVPREDVDGLRQEIRDAQAILTCYTRFSEDMIRSAQQCKIIARSGIGVDTIPVQLATDMGIAVTNVPDYCVDEVADHTMALMLSLVRRIDDLARLARDGVWDYERAGQVYRLAGRKLGLVGFGNIARQVARRAKVFKLELLVFDPFISQADLDAMGAQRMELNDLLAQSDIVSLHVPLNASTKHLIDDAALGRMKSDAYLVNTSRGGLVNTEALCRALEQSQLAGAALDVLDDEPPTELKLLAATPGLLLTPHAAFNSEEATRELREKSASEIARVLRGQAPHYQINKQ